MIMPTWQEGLDPTLRAKIAAFLDEFFVEEELQDFSTAAMEEADVAVTAARPAPQSIGYRAAGMLGGLFGHYGAARGSDAAAGHFIQAKAALDGDDASCADAGSGLKSWLDQVDEPFSTTLLSLIDRKGLDDVEVYKRANMSRQLFSRIRSDASYRPAKKTVLALAIAMGLSLDETRDLLERAGFALSRSSKQDLIVEYFVSHGIHDIFAVNEALYEFDQPLL